MATVLFLNDRQVYPAAQQNIKLTRENPYFSDSESYTLDVSLPMDILENRSFFGNLQRMERSKRAEAMTCRLLVDNRPVIVGSAKVTQVTEKEVKVQLLGGRSEVNFLSENNDDYVDTLPLGRCSRGGVVDTGVRVATSPINDETSGGFSWQAQFQYNLIDIFCTMLKHYGFTVVQNDLDVEPWNRIFVASAKDTPYVSHVLPHWRPREFFTEFCHFFNVVVDIDAIRRQARIVLAPTFFSTSDIVSIEPEDEYTAELSGEAGSALASNNISFDLSGSEHHDYDMLQDSLRENAPSTEYDTYADALQAYNAMTGDKGKMQVFRCPVGSFTGWDHDYTDMGEEKPKRFFTQIDVLAPLKRGIDGAAETKLKICPVAMAETESTATFGTGDGAYTITRYYHLPSLENPTGNEWSSGRFGWQRGGESENDDDADTPIQDYIEGNGQIEKAEKEDRLQVMFVDDVPQTFFVLDSRTGRSRGTAITGFVDWQYKKNHAGDEHRHWSMSLLPTSAEFYLGQLHRNGFSFNVKAKVHVKFLADQIPEPTRIFAFRGKLYGCEKIEASISDGIVNPLMDGYFYEIVK